jgi:hypothetical protein
MSVDCDPQSCNPKDYLLFAAEAWASSL